MITSRLLERKWRIDCIAFRYKCFLKMSLSHCTCSKLMSKSIRGIIKGYKLNILVIETLDMNILRLSRQCKNEADRYQCITLNVS